MILAIGKALKLCELLNSHSKEYVAEVILGIETDTLDMDTNATILREENVNVGGEEIYQAVNSFKGKYLQEVPKYSAVKVNGRKLYEYARSNIPVELPKKEVVINDIAIIDDIRYEKGKVLFKIKTNVSSGTYIRALIRDIGRRLNVPAVMNSLVRTSVDKYMIKLGNNMEDQNIRYELISIIIHVGNSGMDGHFYTYCKSPIDRKWYWYNDAIVKEISDPLQVIKGIPYLLFYQKLKD